MNELKAVYNKHLQRFNKACMYLDSPERTNDEAMKWKPEFDQVCRNMSDCINQMDKQEIKYTENDLVRGFENC